MDEVVARAAIMRSATHSGKSAEPERGGGTEPNDVKQEECAGRIRPLGHPLSVIMRVLVPVLFHRYLGFVPGDPLRDLEPAGHEGLNLVAS